MKQNIKTYFILNLSLLIFAFFTSLILSLLEKNEVLTYNTSIIIANSISYLIIAILSFILGYKVKKQGLLHGLFLSIIMISFTLIIGNSLSDIVTTIKVITKTILILFFTILGVNKRDL